MCHIFDKNYKLPKDLKLDLGGFDLAMKEIAINLDKIAQDIRERKDNAMAMEFTKCIGELLKKNGVSVKITEYETENHATNKFEMLYGYSIDELDFSEHDKVFEDKIASLEKQIEKMEAEKNTLRTRCMESARDNFDNGIYGCLTIVKYPNELEAENRELKQYIAELERKETEKSSEIETSTPINCANSLINHLTHLEAFLIAPERYEKTFNIDELEQIAEHLLVYCKHNKEKE